jgi:hypothetical protein
VPFQFIFFATWCAAPVLESAAALRLAKNGVARRFPLVLLYLVFCAARSTLLISVWHTPKIYGKVWDATLPLGLLVQCLAIIQVFWVMVERYPNFRRIGTVGMSVLGLGGVALVAVTSKFGVMPNPSLRDLDLILQRYGCMVLAFALVGIAVLLPKSPSVPIRLSAFRAATILGIDAMLTLILSAVQLAVTPHASSLSLLTRELLTEAPLLAKCVEGALWLFWMTPESHKTDELEGFTDSDRWELMRLIVRLRPTGLR